MEHAIYTIDIQTAIPTIDREVMHDILYTQLLQHGTNAVITTATIKGVPLYLIKCNNGVSYVCTRAQALYFINNLQQYGHNFIFKEDATAFRVLPQLVNIQHASKGAQYGTHYINISKAHGYSGCLHI